MNRRTFIGSSILAGMFIPHLGLSASDKSHAAIDWIQNNWKIIHPLMGETR